VKGRTFRAPIQPSGDGGARTGSGNLRLTRIRNNTPLPLKGRTKGGTDAVVHAAIVGVAVFASSPRRRVTRRRQRPIYGTVTDQSKAVLPASPFR